MVSPLRWGRGCRLDETREQDFSFPGPSSGHRLRRWAGPPNQKETGARQTQHHHRLPQHPHFLAEMSKKQELDCRPRVTLSLPVWQVLFQKEIRAEER